MSCSYYLRISRVIFWGIEDSFFAGPMPEASGASTVSTFVAALRYNFGLQLLARVASFGINFYLLRAVTTKVLGIANVRCDF